MSDQLELDYVAPTPGAPTWLTQPEGKLEHSFAAFHMKHPEVYRELERVALLQAVAGAKRIGIAFLVELLRRERSIEARDEAGFKINNSYRAFYARLLLYYRKELQGVIETREQKHHRGEANIAA